MSGIRTVPADSPEYSRDYRAGWQASERYTEGALERADQRGVSHAWYDGYHDQAAGRERYAYRTARQIADKINAMGFRAFVGDGRAYVSAENGDGAADYYGEFVGGYPWINPKLEALAMETGGYWDWVNAGQIVYVPQ